MLFYDLVTERQADAGTLDTGRNRFIGTVKLFKDTALVKLGDSRTSVLDQLRHFHFVRSLLPDINLSTGSGILLSIGQQVQ